MIRPAAALSLPLLAALVAATLSCGESRPRPSRVVIVTFDTTRADRIGCYGYPGAATPNLDALADAAVLFEQAVSPVPTTLPAHSTLFTGVYPQDHGVRYNLVYRLSQEAVTLAEILRDAGWATAGFPASFIVASRFGLDQGFETYAEPPGGPGAMEDPRAHGGLRAGEVVDLAVEWLEERPADSPVFLWVHFYDAHAPYDPPFPYSDTYRDRPYEGELAYADAQFGRLLEHLRSSSGWDQTLLIVVGDHGEGLHEHGERFHANLVYETTQRVPLIVRSPGQSPGRVSEPVGVVDIMPTVLDLVALPPPPTQRGVSLRPALEGRRLDQRDLYFESLAGALNYGWTELKGVRWGRWKLIDSNEPELFDLLADPGETENLAGVEAERVLELREVLQALAEPVGESNTAEAAQDAILDAETEAFLAGLGYLGGGTSGSAVGAKHPRRVIDIEPEILAAQIAASSGEWDTLEDVCRYVLARDPKNKFGLNNLVTALLATERPAEAEEHAAAFIEHYPYSDRGYWLLAQTLNAVGETARALEVLERGLAVLPDAEGLRFLTVVAAFDLGFDDVCSERVPQALERHSTSQRLLVLRARCEARGGDADVALATLSEAAELGFREFEALRKSGDFASVTDLPGFEELVESHAPVETERPESEYGYVY